MEKLSSKVRDKEESKSKTQSLIQQFKDLENEWKLLQLTKPRNQRTSSTHTHYSTNTTSIVNLLQTSPRGLMSSLQDNNSPFDNGFRVKTRDIAVEEILRDRRAAIMSGKLKGRRLFGADERSKQVELDLNYGEGVGESDDCYKELCSFSGSCLSEEKGMVVEEEMVEKSGGDRRRRGGGGCMAWFGFVLILLITVGFITVRCSGKYVHEYDDFVLVPT